MNDPYTNRYERVHQPDDGRPPFLITKKPTSCCGVRALVKVDNDYRCPCGNRQERLAKETICEQIFDPPIKKS